MTRFLFALIAAATLGGPALAQPTNELAENAIGIAMRFMAGNYACRHVYGSTARYDAARSIATDTIVLAGGSRDEAILFVDGMHQKFAGDPRSENNGLTYDQCSSTLDETLYNLQAAQAKLRAQQ